MGAGEVSCCALLINNYGGLSNLEVGVVVKSCVAWFRGGAAASSSSSSLKLSHLIVGPVMTSLGMRGFSLSLLPLDRPAPGGMERLQDLLMAPTGSNAWPKVVPLPTDDDSITTTTREEEEDSTTTIPTGEAASQLSSLLSRSDILHHPGRPLACTFLAALVETSTAALLASESLLNELDSKVGDGDTGETFKQMAHLVDATVLPPLRAGCGRSNKPPPPARRLDSESLKFLSSQVVVEGPSLFQLLLTAMLSDMSDALGEFVGGSSGMLYTLLLRVASTSLAAGASCVEAFSSALLAVGSAANSKEGDRSMLDALHPALRAAHAALLQGRGLLAAFREAGTAAELGAQATACMLPCAGRSSWISPEITRGISDPGAVAASIWISALARAFEKES